MNFKTRRYQIELVNFGSFRLDGGAMFGSVPKNLWSRLVDVDQENCIPLVTRSLLIRGEGRTILVDVGNGDKWSDKMRSIFAFSQTPLESLPFQPDDVTDILLTHLHFDHAGGISKYDEDGKLVPVYKNARVHLQRANFDNARSPNLREKASYLPENVDTLKDLSVEFLEGNTEVFPDIFVERVDGHTVGQQVIKILGGDKPILFPTDLCPTSAHLPTAYNMGYDICADTLLKEKEAFLSSAVEQEALVIFEHDPKVEGGTVVRNEKGQFALGPI